MEKFIITQKLTDGERYRLFIYIMIRTAAIKKTLKFLSMFFIFGFLMLMIRMNISLVEENFFPSIMIVFAPLILIALLFLSPLIGIKIQKMDPPVYEFDDWGMTMATGKKNLNVPWQDLVSYKELPKYILITMSSHEFNTHIIPKSEFRDDAEIKSFIELLIHQRLKRN